MQNHYDLQIRPVLYSIYHRWSPSTSTKSNRPYRVVDGVARGDPEYEG